MEKRTFAKKWITPKHLAVAGCLALVAGVFYLNEVPWPVYAILVMLVWIALSPYKMDDKYLVQGNFVAVAVPDIDKLLIKESGSVTVYYHKPYKEKEYSVTLYPADTEGFVAALQQVNQEMTILRENL